MPAAWQSSRIANGTQTGPFDALALPLVRLALADTSRQPKWKVAGLFEYAIRLDDIELGDARFDGAPSFTPNVTLKSTRGLPDADWRKARQP